MCGQGGGGGGSPASYPVCVWAGWGGGGGPALHISGVGSRRRLVGRAGEVSCSTCTRVEKDGRGVLHVLVLF